MSFGYCTTVDHVKEEIIGLCFDQGCDKNKFICFICYTQQHSKHQNDCLRFSDVIQMIPNCISILDNMQQQQENKMESMLTLFKKNLKFIQSEKDSLLQLKQQLQNQESQYINREFEKLKQWRNITLNKIAKNNISIQLDDIKKFEKSLDQFFQIYLKANLIQIKEIEQNVTGSIKIQELKFPTQNYKSENLAIECLTSAIDLYKVDNYQEALNFSNQALKSDPNLEQAYMIKGLSLLNLGQYEEAADSFDDCLRLDLKIDTVYYHKGFCLQVLQHFDEAIQCYDKALELKVDTEFYLKKAQALFQLQKFNEALDSINQALEKTTKQSYLQLKGAILHKLGNSNEELQCYLAALEFDKNSSLINHNVGTALYCLKRYEESLKFYEAALQLEQNSPDSLNQKGLTLLALNRYQQALECFDSAIKFEEKVEYLTNKAKTLIVLNRQKESLEIYEYIRLKYGE